MMKRFIVVVVFSKLWKIKLKSNKIKNINQKIKIQIDGGINNKTIIRAKSYADSFVSGSYVQNAKSSKEAINNLEKLANN